MHDRRGAAAGGLGRLKVAYRLGGSCIALRRVRVECDVGDAMAVTGSEAEQQKEDEITHHTLGGVAG